MPNQIPDEIKQERYHELMALQAQISEEIHKDTEARLLKFWLKALKKTVRACITGVPIVKLPISTGWYLLKIREILNPAVL